MFSRQAPRQFSVFSLSYKKRRAETQLRILSVTCVFVGGVLFFSLHGKKRKHKTPQQTDMCCFKQKFPSLSPLRKVKKSKQLVREQTKPKRQRKPKTKTEHSRCRRFFSTPNWPFPPSLLECMHGLTNRTSNVGSVCAGGFREESSLMTGCFVFSTFGFCFFCVLVSRR
jgi:hypothetical protein